MESVERGGDRQQSHEIIRRHSLEAADRMKAGEAADLLDQLGSDPAFNLSAEDVRSVMNPDNYIGRSIEQVEQFLANIPDYEQNQDQDEIGL